MNTFPRSSSARSRRGFTLVELMIVVVILGLLAAVVIPQFQNVTEESKESALAGDLATIRQAIALYRVQHNETYPGQTDWNEFGVQLTQATAPDGSVGGNLGPYLRKIPKNPVNDSADAVHGAMPAGASGTEGWAYDPTTGEIRANVPGTAPSGTSYWDL